MRELIEFLVALGRAAEAAGVDQADAPAGARAGVAVALDDELRREPEPEPGEMEVARDAPRLIPSRVVIDFLRTIFFLIFNTKK